MEWVPREETAFADELSKLFIPDDWMLAPSFFTWLDSYRGPHSVDSFASRDNTQCGSFYSLHWCRGTLGVNAFGYSWSGENGWINAPYRVIGRVSRALREQNSMASILVPLWESSTGWHLVVPDAIQLSESVVDWVWPPWGEMGLFLGGAAPGRSVLLMAVKVDFSTQGYPRRWLSKRG